MNRADHLETAEAMLRLVDQLMPDPAQPAAAAEMVWGATVHALSAVDPQHEAINATTGAHDAPCFRRTFLPAARRAINPALSLAYLETCLQNNQGRLHTYFYHLNLSRSDWQESMTAGRAYVQRIIDVGNVIGV